MSQRTHKPSRGWWGRPKTKYTPFGGDRGAIQYRSLSGSSMDSEKERSSNDYTSYSDDDEEAPSLVNSADPMLPQYNSASNGKKKQNYALRYHHPRRRFTRYFTLAISSILILLVLFLVHSSWRSDDSIRDWRNKPPPPPPAWEQFPFLRRYYGGLRSVVSKGESETEYPTGDEEEAVLEMMLKKGKEEGEEGVEEMKEKVKKGGRKGHAAKGNGTVGAGKKALPKSVRFNPYKNDEGSELEARVPCYLDDKKKTTIPALLAYEGIPSGFPDPVMGSYETLGLRDDICYERYGRLGPYGYGYSQKFGGSGAGMKGEREGAKEVWGGQLEVDYRGVKWAEVQERCLKANGHRFRKAETVTSDAFTSMEKRDQQSGHKDVKPSTEDTPTAVTSNDKTLVSRTVILIRTWKGYEYDAEDMFYLRALINELTLQSGAEYTVHFLIHVKDNNLQIWADEATYKKALAEALPKEFQGMGTLWSEHQMGLIYDGLQETNYRDHHVHGAYRSTYMPVQYWSQKHPEFDFVWHWEMDVRYTGHYYHLFHQVSEWAKQQPRKGLWERNGRFYIPSEHGSYEDFKQMVRIQTEQGTATKDSIFHKLAADAGSRHALDSDSRKPSAPVWGPERPYESEGGDGSNNTTDPESDPVPTTAYEKDHYTWGIGEEADFITFNPLFDPERTNWLLSSDVTGYNTTAGLPPRRSAIITASRLSRRLLQTMHEESTFARHHMFSEMWPPSIALHHGYKAVYAPHPVYIDRRWPTSYLAAIFNNGLHGASGGSRTSVFGSEREHNFMGTSWYYNAGFAPNLWRRWLGYRVDGEGGERWEMAKGVKQGGSGKGEGRMCLPGMLLHPVKGVGVVEEGDG